MADADGGSDVKLTDLTPDKYRSCAIAACPAVFKTDRGTYVVIGKVLDDGVVPEGRVGPGEIAVELPGDLLDAAELATKTED